VSLPVNTISRLQSVLNAAARLVFSSWKHHHVSPLLQRLHWLKIKQRIEYKLALLVYRCLNGLAPQYLANELQPVSSLDARRRLRSATTDALVVPPTRLSTVGDRAFSVAAARVWNSLPGSVTSAAFRVRTIPKKTPNTQYPIILAYPNANTQCQYQYRCVMKHELNASQKLCKSIYYTYYSHVLSQIELKTIILRLF